MLIGEAWSNSKQKRLVDISAGIALAPLSTGLELTSRVAFGPDAKNYPTLLASERVGVSSNIDRLATFIMYKVRTGPIEFDPAFNNLAQTIRAVGLDEIGQYLNLLNGTMSLRGHRPMPVRDLEKVYDKACDGALVDRHRRIVLPKKPGIFSSSSVASHLHTPGAELESDIKDEIDGSFTYDMTLVATYTKGCLNAAMKTRTN